MAKILRGKVRFSVEDALKEVWSLLEAQQAAVLQTLEFNRDCLKRLEALAARFVLPQEALDDLTGEMRAIRQLLDEKGAYSFIDRNRTQRDRQHRLEPTAGPLEPPVIRAPVYQFESSPTSTQVPSLGTAAPPTDGAEPNPKK